MILESFQVRSFQFFPKYPKHEWPKKFTRRNYYGYMNEPNMKWNESTKTTDTRETILKSFFIETETGTKNGLKQHR